MTPSKRDSQDFLTDTDVEMYRSEDPNDLFYYFQIENLSQHPEVTKISYLLFNQDEKMIEEKIPDKNGEVKFTKFDNRDDLNYVKVKFLYHDQPIIKNYSITYVNSRRTVYKFNPLDLKYFPFKQSIFKVTQQSGQIKLTGTSGNLKDYEYLAD